MCRSQQKKEITEAAESSEEECFSIQTFNSCEETEIMSVELNANRMDSIDRYIQWRLEKKEKCQKQSINNSELQKIDIRRDHKLEIVKSLRALV